MAYRIELEEPIEAAVRRIADEQIEGGLADLAGGERDLHVAIHELRKRCKKVRALLRLVRPALGAGIYPAENAALRDAAALLAPLRDAEVLAQTVESLLAEHLGQDEGQGQGDADAFEPVRAALRARRDERARVAEREGTPDLVAERLRAARSRLPWKLERDGVDAVAGGLQKTYRRGRRAMAAAYAAPAPERFHEWRKRAKYGMYQFRLLRALCGGSLDAREESQHELSNLLGDHHDLAVLLDDLGRTPELYGGPALQDRLRDWVRTRRDGLEARARGLGARLYAERPKAFGRRLRRDIGSLRRSR